MRTPGDIWYQHSEYHQPSIAVIDKPELSYKEDRERHKKLDEGAKRVRVGFIRVLDLDEKDKT